MGDAARQQQAQRLRGLSTGAASVLRDVAQHVQRGDLAAAERALAAALVLAPHHAETLRLHGLVEHRRGRLASAEALHRAALQARPQDPILLVQLAELLGDMQRGSEAVDVLDQACAHAGKDADAWVRAGVQYDRHALHEASIGAGERALALEPAHPLVHVLLGRGLAATGRTGDAARHYRRMIAAGGPRAWQAWFSLVDLKTVRLDPGELRELERAHAVAPEGSEARGVLGFALGLALEQAGRHPQAWDAFAGANAWRRRSAPWDAARFSREVDAMRAAFAVPHAQAEPQGGEVIFIVGLPRSGTTLVEQVLAAHPEVEGASELPDLPTVLAQETARRGVPYPRWCTEASEADWTRLGTDYLSRTARWRQRRPRSSDKLPGNWLHLGAIRAMLPQARIIDTRRDPVESCWSCFKQLFAPGLADYTYDLAELAAYWRDYDRFMREWADRAPDQIRVQSLERLQSAPEKQIRELLEFCGLPFEPACLASHEAPRAIRTPSAAQVREPLQPPASRSAAYGERLSGLRRALSGA